VKVECNSCGRAASVSTACCDDWIVEFSSGALTGCFCDRCQFLEEDAEALLREERVRER